MELEQEWRTGISAEAGGFCGELIPLPPTELEYPQPMLNEKDFAAAHYVLHIKGHTGSGGSRLAKGLIGFFNPVKVRALGSKLYLALPPGVGRKNWAIGYYPTHYPLEALPANHTMMTERRKAAPQQPTLASRRAVPGDASAAGRTHMLSALTSALSMTGRA